MSIATDQAVKDLQEKVAWLERALATLRAELLELQQAQPIFKTEEKPLNGTLSLNRKKS